MSEAPAAGRPRLVARLLLAYDGTDFHGWQVQPGLRTVQGELAAAIARLMPLATPPPGAGRTDAGVHARGQVASLPLADDALLERLARALPRMVPEDLAVLEVTAAPPDFHARFSATGRHYAYRLMRRPDPLRRRQHWLVPHALDVGAMRAAAALLVGEHDCTSFCLAASAEPGRMVCRIRRAELVGAPADDTLALHMEADRFVHSMVRAVAGTLVEVGRGRRAPESISAILLARDRRAAGEAAPPHGLCLESVDYAR